MLNIWARSGKSTHHFSADFDYKNCYDDMGVMSNGNIHQANMKKGSDCYETLVYS